MNQLNEATEKLNVSGPGDDASAKDTRAPSKNALKKASKEAEKARKKAESAAAKAAASKTESQGDDSVDMSQGKYGYLPLIQSTNRTGESLQMKLGLTQR